MRLETNCSRGSSPASPPNHADRAVPRRDPVPVAPAADGQATAGRQGRVPDGEQADRGRQARCRSSRPWSERVHPCPARSRASAPAKPMPPATRPPRRSGHPNRAGHAAAEPPRPGQAPRATNRARRPPPVVSPRKRPAARAWTGLAGAASRVPRRRHGWSPATSRRCPRPARRVARAGRASGAPEHGLWPPQRCAAGLRPAIRRRCRRHAPPRLRGPAPGASGCLAAARQCPRPKPERALPAQRFDRHKRSGPSPNACRRRRRVGPA